MVCLVTGGIDDIGGRGGIEVIEGISGTQHRVPSTQQQYWKMQNEEVNTNNQG